MIPMKMCPLSLLESDEKWWCAYLAEKLMVAPALEVAH